MTGSAKGNLPHFLQANLSALGQGITWEFLWIVRQAGGHAMVQAYHLWGHG